jgi:outer membrane immunogenic protein
MKLKLALLAAVATLAAPAVMSASAQATGLYASGGYANFSFDTGTDDVNLGGIQGRLGYGFTPNLAIEGEGTLGVADDGGAELDNELGVFGVGKIAVSPQIDLFARVGVSRTEVNGFDDDGLAYGAGAQWNLTSQDGIRGDWTRHDYDAGEFDAWSLSYVRQF